jgi:aspartyl-tRNA(Asn)/glutamyl-tRNA(Gln) amidotransferase subunit A
MPCYYLIAPAEASANLARYDGVRYALRVDADNYYEMVARSRDAGFGDEPKRRIMLGTYALSAGYYEAYYGQAQRVRTVIAQEFEAAFERYDVLVSPTSPTVAFPCSRFRRTWPDCQGCRSPVGSPKACRWACS